MVEGRRSDRMLGSPACDDGSAGVRRLVSRIPIVRQEDILHARQAGRDIASEVGFGTVHQTRIATAISELARNALRYADGGECRISTVESENGTEVWLELEDAGPGIANIELALTPGYSTGGGFGLGLPAVRNLMDSMAIESHRGRTLVTARMERRRS